MIERPALKIIHEFITGHLAITALLMFRQSVCIEFIYTGPSSWRQVQRPAKKKSSLIKVWRFSMRTKPTFAILVLIAAILACNTPCGIDAASGDGYPVHSTGQGDGDSLLASPRRQRRPRRPPSRSLRRPMCAEKALPPIAKSPSLCPRLIRADALPVNLASVTNYRQFKIGPAQEKLLTQNGFVVAPAEWLEFFQVYEDTRYKELPVFVTTDSVYHIYHLIFDKMLRDLERENFAPDIAALTRACVGIGPRSLRPAQGHRDGKDRPACLGVFRRGR